MTKHFITLNEVEKCLELSKYKDFSILGKGANAVVFKAMHKITGQLVVIKIYAIFESDKESREEKCLLEIKKNAAFRLTKNQAVVFDAGLIYSQNRKYVYSVMNYIDGITLKEWLQRKCMYKKELSEDITIIEINAALGFLYCYYNLLENDEELVHGDINDGNVIFLRQNNQKEDSDNFLTYCTRYSDYLIPTTVEFIDYGTSKWEMTNTEEGIKRDLNFIMKNTEKLLSSYPIKNFIDYNAICNEQEEYKKYHRRYFLVVDLIRIILSIYFLDEWCTVPGFEEQSPEFLWAIWRHDFKYDENFDFNFFLNLKYWFALKEPSKGRYINKKKIIEYMNNKNKDKYEIIFSEKFEKPTINFK